MRHQVRAAGTLLECLERLVPGAARRTLRQFLARGRVRVNGTPARAAKHAVAPGDVVEVGPPAPRLPAGAGLTILHEDADILVVNKRENLLTIATARERERTAYAILADYVRQEACGNRIFIVHRLDRPTSGVLVLARSQRAKRALQDQFRARTADRRYVAVVEKAVDPPRGILESYLVEDAHRRVRSTSDRTRGKLAVTRYRVLRQHPRYPVLEIELETGRKGQIRAQLAEAGHPIVGDRDYGAATDPMKRLGLHAWRLAFTHPGTGRPVAFEAPLPPPFRRFLFPGPPAGGDHQSVPPQKSGGGETAVL